LGGEDLGLEGGEIISGIGKRGGGGGGGAFTWLLLLRIGAVGGCL
jgi:hypothetical protein